MKTLRNEILNTKIIKLLISKINVNQKNDKTSFLDMQDMKNKQDLRKEQLSARSYYSSIR